MSSKPAILGGSPVRKEPFPPRVTMGEPERKAVLEVIDSDVLSAFLGGPGSFFLGGPKVRAFEAAWAEKFGFRHAVSVNSWTSGLVAAVGAVGVEPGDEVICPAYTMSASATCVLFYGGVPVFADIDPVTFCLDAESVEACITPRTRAIIVVHLFGCPADMDAIMEVARRHDLKVIEDAAQAPGVYYKGQPVGAIGDVGGFSFNFHKHIHTGEGGMIVTNDDFIARRCQLIRNHGENAIEGTDEAAASAVGGNYRLSELHAAVGLAQIARLDDLLQSRKSLAEKLTARLRDIPGLTPPRVPDECSHAFYVYPIRFDAIEAGLPRGLFAKAVRAEFPAAFGAEGTPLTEGYVRPLYLARIYQERLAFGSRGFAFNCTPDVEYSYPEGLCPVTERMYREELLISPVVREPLSLEDMDQLADAMEKVLEHSDEIRKSSALECEPRIYTPFQAATDGGTR